MRYRWLLLFSIAVVCFTASCGPGSDSSGMGGSDSKEEETVSLDIEAGLSGMGGPDLEDEETQTLMAESDPFLIANETLAQIIDSFMDGTIAESEFPYEEMPPEGTILPVGVREDIGSGVSAFNLIDLGENSYLAEVPCPNPLRGRIFLYVGFEIGEDSISQVSSIYFSDTRRESGS